MAFLVEIIGSLLAETSNFLIRCTITRIQTDSNIKTLETEIQKLTELKNSIAKNIDLARKEGKSPTAQVYKWLLDVSEIECEVCSMLADSPHACSLCCNLCYRYQHSEAMIEKIKKVKLLVHSCNSQVISPEKSSPVKAVQKMFAPSLVRQQPALEKIERLMKLLKDDNINRIGVFGMGGVGKTTLLMNLINNFECYLIEFFDIVIWVTVSRDLDYHEVQSAIAERLNLEFDAEESMQQKANRLHSRFMMKKKSLLILDNVWGEVDLGCIGVPQGDDREKCKIIITTRSLDICRKMVTDEDIKVEALGEELAWNLFAQFAGDVVKSKDIETHARDICRRCYGLPLLIKTMGISMRNKKMIELWKDKCSSLMNPAPNFRCLDEKVYRTLKLSYDSMSEVHQSCFLYCSLYPSNYSIKPSELIECWMADGLVDKLQSLDKSFNRGIALVESLRDFCILEKGDGIGTVKMHDLWRDVAARINSEEKESGFLCQDCISSSKLHVEAASSKHYIRRISLMYSNSKTLPAWLQKCSHLNALLLQGNPLEKIPDFFLDLKEIRYLNLSHTPISFLPPSLLQLRELHTLLLRGCHHLDRLPSLGALCKLEVLDLSDTPVQKLSRDMGKRLKKLNLSDTYNLENIEAGTLLGMPSLEYLDTSFSAYKWDVEQYLVEKRSVFHELSSLERLSSLRIRLDNVNYLATEDCNWIRRLRTFRIWIGPIICESYDDALWDSDEKRATFRGVDLKFMAWGRGVELLLCSVRSLDLITFEGIYHLSDFICRNNLHGLQNLKSLTLSGSSWIRTIFCGEGMRRGVLPNLEHLALDRLENLVKILDGMLPKGYLSKLKTIEVANCPKLRKLISYAFLQRLQNLERISVSGCETMRYIFSAQIPNEDLPDLTLLELRDLKCLTDICPGKSDWPAHERIKVSDCPKLLRRPSSFNKGCPPKETRGDFEKQNSSEGLDEDTKANLREDFEFPSLKFQPVKKRQAEEC